MFFLRRFAFLVVLLLLLSFVGRAQTYEQSFKIGSKEVLLDVIVRDKKGRNVRDLRAEEIEVYEDGVKQTISSLRLIESSATTASTPPNTNQISFPVDPARPVNLVTMVFDNLDNSSRKLAREAALDFVNSGMRQNVMVAVYSVGNRFYVLQSFTTDKDKVRQAIEMATNRAEVQYPDVSRKIAEQMEIVANSADFGPGAGAPAQAQAAVIPDSTPAVPTMPSGLAPTGVGRGGTGLDKAIAQITLNTLRAVETAMAEQQARASIYTFLHVAREQKRLLGRKTLLYFSTGLVVPPNLVDVLRTTMSEANRANVSIYAIDARGLQIDNESERARIQLAQAISASNAAYNEGGSMSSLAGSFKSAEMAEGSLRQNKQGTLAELAEGTGGRLIANTNDLRKPIRQVAEEIGSYYALSYAPTSQELDGKFRQITIKLLRPDLKATSRSGYFAVPALDGKAVMGYEMPMLAALNEAMPKRDFPYQVSVLRFAPGREAQHLLLLAVPLSEITFKTDKGKKLYSTHLSVLALVKNEKGEVVARLSQDYPLQGRLERLESLKKGNFDFTKPFTLAPGKYVLQTVVYDFGSNKISVQSHSLAVPQANANLAISSLTLIKRLEAAGLNKASDDKPLLTAQGRIVPNLGDTINVAAEKALGFYLVAYTTAKDKAQLTLEFLQDGKGIAQTTMELPAPGEKGRIHHLFSVPAESFNSGTYQVRAVVRQGNLQAEDSTSFSLNNPNPAKKAEVPAAQALAAADEAANPGPEVAPPAPARPIATTGISAAVLAATKSRVSNRSSGAAAVNIPALLGEVEKNGIALYQQLLGFTYQLRKVHHVLNDAGEPTNEEFQDYEAYPVRGRHVLIKIAEGGKRLPGWEIEQERKRAGGELERTENDTTSEVQSYLTASISGSYRGKAAGLLLDPAAFLHASDFVDPRLETLDGREMIVLDFLPRLGEKLSVTKAFVANLTGTIWIDAIDKVLVRLEAKNIVPGVGKDGKPLPNGSEPKLVYQQMKLPGGEWFPVVIRMNADGDASAFYGLNWDVVFEFKEYKKFAAEGDEYRFIAPEKKP